MRRNLMPGDLKRRAVKIASIVAVTILVVAAVLVVPSFRDPKFKIVNESAEVISVVASWRDEQKKIEAIGPSSSHEFSVVDEAAMKFTVRYSGGREAESEEIYFTRGVTVIAIISAGGVEVRYDFET